MTTRMLSLALGCLFSILLTRGAEPAWPDAVAQALDRAGTNRVELEAALRTIDPARRDALHFLIENMPERDLQTLSGAYLQDNIQRAFAALAAAPWRDRIPRDLFLNDILPYACTTERRDEWRKQLVDQCAELVKDCTTPGMAARRLNERLFPLVKVKYSTQRRRPDQCASETIETGLASCTGLSILLIDACRAVGVPARLVGTPNWVDKRGNHTWVEVWDDGWHFLGAAEPDPNGLDRGWFVGDASRAIKDSREHAIYATSFRRTGISFPLVWASRVTDVPAVNVTDRYTAAKSETSESETRLFVEVRDSAGGQRVAASVRVLDPADAAFRQEGQSRDERADTNDLLEFKLRRNHAYRVEAELAGRNVSTNFPGTPENRAVVKLALGTPPPAPNAGGSAVSPAASEPPVAPPKSRLSRAQERRVREALAAYFSAANAEPATWKFPASLDRLLLKDDPTVRRLAWEAFRNAPIHETLKADFEAKQVRFEQHLSPYTVKTVGRRPGGGWPLFIAMHGGGNAPKQVNDQQWRVMQNYYRDQDSVTGYLYVALRAPNDTWNGFYDNYVYPLIENLISQFLLFADVDPDKVFILGYSHGGYGAFAIGPKIPDRFAAVHASAAAPTDGETSAKTLRNTRFTFMIGEKDLAYGRLPRCQAFAKTIESLRGERKDIYPVTMEFIAGNGHTGLPDRDKIKGMYPAVRNPVPRELSWELTDPVVRNFFWLAVAQPAKKQEIEAVCRDNHLSVSTKEVHRVTVSLDERLVDFRRPVLTEFNGRKGSVRVRPSLKVLCETLATRRDPGLAFSARLELSE